MNPSINLNRAALVTRREIRDSLRDWRIVAPILLLTAIFPWLMSFASRMAANFAVDYGVADNAAIILQQLVPFSLLIVGFFPISFSLVIALETFVGERERNTLEPLLATPVSDAELYLAKLVAAISLPLVASYLGLFLHLVSLMLTTSYRILPVALIQVLLLTTFEALVMVSGAVVVSSHTTSIRAANLLASFIIIPVALIIQGEAVLLFWERYTALWWVILGLLVVSVALVRTGMRLFNREEILAREFDTLNLSTIWREVKLLWEISPQKAGQGGGGSSSSLLDLYREHLPALLSLHRLPLFVAFLVMLGGFVIGWFISQWYPIPSSAVGLQGFVGSPFSQNWPELTLLPNSLAWGIFFHNARALLFSAALGIFSFGTFPLLLTMPTMGLVGFFAGQAYNLGYDPLLALGVFVFPHGILELPAAWLATGFALQIGLALMAPPPGLSLGRGLLLAVVNYAKVFLLLVLPLLLAAALLETWVTPLVIRLFFG